MSDSIAPVSAVFQALFAVVIALSLTSCVIFQVAQNLEDISRLSAEADDIVNELEDPGASIDPSELAEAQDLRNDLAELAELSVQIGHMQTISAAYTEFYDRVDPMLERLRRQMASLRDMDQEMNSLTRANEDATAEIQRSNTARVDQLLDEMVTLFGVGKQDHEDANQTFQTEMAKLNAVLEGIPGGASMVSIEPDGQTLPAVLGSLGEMILYIPDYPTWVPEADPEDRWWDQSILSVDVVRPQLASIRAQIDGQVRDLNQQPATAVDEANRIIARLREIRDNATGSSPENQQRNELRRVQTECLLPL